VPEAPKSSKSSLNSPDATIVLDKNISPTSDTNGFFLTTAEQERVDTLANKMMKEFINEEVKIQIEHSTLIYEVSDLQKQQNTMVIQKQKQVRLMNMMLTQLRDQQANTHKYNQEHFVEINDKIERLLAIESQNKKRLRAFEQKMVLAKISYANKLKEMDVNRIKQLMLESRPKISFVSDVAVFLETCQNVNDLSGCKKEVPASDANKNVQEAVATSTSLLKSLAEAKIRAQGTRILCFVLPWKMGKLSLFYLMQSIV